MGSDVCKALGKGLVLILVWALVPGVASAVQWGDAGNDSRSSFRATPPASVPAGPCGSAGTDYGRGDCGTRSYRSSGRGRDHDGTWAYDDRDIDGRQDRRRGNDPGVRRHSGNWRDGGGRGKDWYPNDGQGGGWNEIRGNDALRVPQLDRPAQNTPGSGGSLGRGRVR